ncbi:OsmC family protein [Mesonia sp. K4-1]|uniref:OsmC family protein n=1 Tax=Mesonia sp. K4-1 TaxID=2602760 RepID=UPI0011C9CAA6|nr:OsmC family protein [Mesonia sp. K4-1]TXK74992.1 OsmC family protein [Mesonia sp. K4-1]
MVTSTVVYEGNLRVRNTHLKSEDTFLTDAPTDNNGKGEAFSPTDVVATALASCMLTIMGILAEREHIDLVGTGANVTKTMASNPRRISKIEVQLTFPKNYDDSTKKKLENAALTCPVHHSLHPDIDKDIQFIYPS